MSERERRKQSRRVKHRFKLERLNSVTGNLSLAGPDRQTDGQARAGQAGQGRARDWQGIHDDIETDGRRHWHVAWEFYFGWHSHSPDLDHDRDRRCHFLSALCNDAHCGFKSQVQGQVFLTTKTECKREYRKSYKENKAPFCTLLYIVLYFSRVYSPSLAYRLDYFGDLFFSPALSIVKILHKSKATATTTEITTNRKPARGNNWMNAKKQKADNKRTNRQT